MRAPNIHVAMLAWLALLLSCAGCHSLAQESAPRAELPDIGLVLTPIPGWSIDTTSKLEDAAKGGLLISMSSASDLYGAPKFQIYLDPLRVKAPTLDRLAQEQWDRMKSVESQAGVSIEKMEKTKATVLNQEAMLLDQTYTLGSGASQIAVSERAWLTIHNERGLAFVISGRTELLTPWSEQIQTMLNSLALQVKSAK
ncbi:MAG: hypothetical protein HOI23_16760 [Deltaproteobacteria bacterium]|nr:hypothetical protein [Deltaproteobacteria bacterium]MBT6433816.1 hypothetical protein [Deltaproteobacteria bacterium]